MQQTSSSSSPRPVPWRGSPSCAGQSSTPPPRQASPASPALAARGVRALALASPLPGDEAAALLARTRALHRDFPAALQAVRVQAPRHAARVQEAFQLALGLAPVGSRQLERQRDRLRELAGEVDQLARRSRSWPMEPPVLAAVTGTLQALSALLEEQVRHVDQLIRSSAFHAGRVDEARAALWDAAANLLAAEAADAAAAPAGEAKAPPEPMAQAVASFRAWAWSLRTNAGKDSGESLLDPRDVAKPRKLKKRGGGQASPASVTASGSASASVPRAAERQRVLAAIGQARREAGLPEMRSRGLKRRFKACLSAVLNRRDNPQVRSTLALPVRVPGGPGQAQALQGQVTVTCRQDPAHILSDALGRSHDADGIQGANCHDSRQHRHATNLYRSTLEDAGGRTLLSLARHGVHSVSALTPEGIRALGDEELGRIALDLGVSCGDPVLLRLAVSSAPGREAEAARYVRAATRLWGIPAFLRDRTAPGLLDRLRAVANQRRAREAAQVAASCLPPTELARLQSESRAGRVPTLRLASISLLTPDIFRGALKGPEMDERRMWNDQHAAWQALAGREVVMDLPAFEDSGRPRVDEAGRPVTRPTTVRVEVAAFNLPVNEAGTGAFARVDAVTGSELTAPANAAAMRLLLGELPTAAGAVKDWMPGGWVGQALRTATGSAETSSPDAGLLLALARQVAQIHVTGQHLGRNADPYGLVKRLLVLVHAIGIAAPLVNCKSGKDRTSEAEAQARQLALQLATGGGLPDPQGGFDEVQALQLWHLHQAGGSREIQAWNTGHAGTKLKHPALFAQYGIRDRRDLQQEYRGMSAHVGS